ncbi:phosphate/phosphite/phosphonate ABC transporter substrate-binding protein [Hoeflea sp. TYP-13]|uniref:phosphate/phosphite/phosphonate ABC transporter substrate-binding protein n=1 Tax=Hoeflea sp. TYP-13 TaxID=3230023 RepID=UPI0034C67BE5
MKRRNIIRSAVLAFTAAALLVAQPLTAAEPSITMAFVPQENPDKLLGDIEQITAYLSKETGVPVKGFVTSDHAAAVEALRNGDADISFMGALPSVIAKHRIGAEPILLEVYRGKPTYRGRVFVRRDSAIETLADLKGKTIAFADPISESGYLFPLKTFVDEGLLEKGADPKGFFGEVYFAGGYQQAIQAMANGLVDAAGVSQYADLLLTPDQQAEIRWIAESEQIPSHTVIARKGLDDDLKTRFIAAMMKLNEPDYRVYLKYVYGPDGYVVADNSAFTNLEALARDYGFID